MTDKYLNQKKGLYKSNASAMWFNALLVVEAVSVSAQLKRLELVEP